MTRVTEGHLARHYQGMKGGRDAALLDIAQDHALHLLHNTGLFDEGLIFKGGTALRKFRAGTPAASRPISISLYPMRTWCSPFYRLSMALKSTGSPSRSITLATTDGEPI
jgi:hypothetical protein